MCGEVLQCQTCRPVCHKYGNEGQCHFLFPHEVVEASYFDAETNSVVLMCRDSTVNYFNPYILIFCRHNHDIKCILSGKAVKASMFYIIDYITKMDMKTYQMLSLMSCAVSEMSDINENNATANAKLLLHKCLAQFTRQQQVHAQQAARYIHGFKDGISSHNTKPMMSAILINNIKQLHSRNISNLEVIDENDNTEDSEYSDDDTEHISTCGC
jgi:hypothetical protein